nr:hypothetical protein [uncultured Draconibacterium sp.]
MRRRQMHWTFFGIYKPNDSEGIFATANSKVCFEALEMNSVLQNDRP